MPRFGDLSTERLQTCDPRIRVVMNSVIRHYDIAVICGHRGKEDQDAALHGRPQRSKAKWPESPHNQKYSMAIDLAPWNGGIDWDDTEEFHFMAGVVLTSAFNHGIELVWGGRFKSIVDLPHFEIKSWKSELE